MAWPHVMCHGSGYSRGSPGEPYKNTDGSAPAAARNSGQRGARTAEIYSLAVPEAGSWREGISVAGFSRDLCPQLRSATSSLGPPAAFPVRAGLCCPLLFL